MTIASTPTSLLGVAVDVMTLLKNEDFQGLSQYVHPTSGLRLSPYQYVNVTSDQVVTAAQLLDFPTDSTIYNWGVYDGTGDPIEMDKMTYFNDFIYDEDYLTAPQVGQNAVLSYGNMINNIEGTYSSADYVEFYFPGFDPQFAGMDWSSLTLVLQEDGGTWYLLGIVHGNWTI